MMNINSKMKRLGLLLPLLLMGLLALGGCESDSVAPDDKIPALTSEDAAYQSVIVALAITEVGPQILNIGPNKDIYSQTYDGTNGVTGTVAVDFRLGGADGAPAPSNTADWAHLYTVDSQGLMFEVPPSGQIYLVLNLLCDLNQDTDTATFLSGSGGTMTAGDYSSTFTLDGLVITATGDYPSAGSIVFESGGHELTIEFDGTATALIYLGDNANWALNLDTGDLTELG